MRGLVERNANMRLRQGHDISSEVKNHEFLAGMGWEALVNKEVNLETVGVKSSSMMELERSKSDSSSQNKSKVVGQDPD